MARHISLANGARRRHILLLLAGAEAAAEAAAEVRVAPRLTKLRPADLLLFWRFQK